MVQFRPQDSWDGEYGFDWLRIGGTAEKGGEDVYKDVLKSGYKDLSAAQAYTLMKDEYKHVTTEIKSAPETLAEYFVPYLNIFPVGTTGTPAPATEAVLKVLVAIEDNAPEKIEFEYDKAKLTLDKDELTDKAVGAKRVASDGTIKITSKAKLKANEEVKVWSTLEGTRTLAGKLVVLKNDSIKKIKFVFVMVDTKVESTTRTGSVSATEKSYVHNSLHQALIQCEIESAPNLDLTADAKFKIITKDGNKTYGEYIYEKKSTDGANRHDGGLNEDLDGAVLFKYVRKKFLDIPANAKYKKGYFTVFAFDEIPYDVNTYGQVQDINEHNVLLFAPVGGRKQTTLAHEILHGLGLPHTHDSPSSSNKYIFKSGKTDNIMSYATKRMSTWKRQWDKIRKGL